MHKLPVNFDILENALALTIGEGFYVTAFSIMRDEVGFWTAKRGVNLDTARSYPNLMKKVEHLLKSRRAVNLRWTKLEPEQRKVFVDTLSCWPIAAKTGAEYVEACAWYDRVEAELGEGEAVSKTPADVQHQRPDVPTQLLFEALTFAMSGGWSVSADFIARHQMIFWDRENGPCGDESYPGSQRIVRLLTQERQRGSGRLTGLTLEMHKDAAVFAGTTGDDCPFVWPWKAGTGEDYLRACAYYDHLIAQKTDHYSPNDELAEVKEAWSGLIPGVGGIKTTPSKLKTALYRATPYELSDVSKVKTLVQKHSPVGAQVCVEVNAEDLHMYDIKVGSETFQYSIPQGATGLIGDRFVPVDLPGQTADEIVVWAETSAVHEQPRPEQPWERDKRVAASAGYAHVSSAEPHDEAHEARLRLIAERIYAPPHDAYVHALPADPLSGTRIDNGWAVSGFAVTDDGFAQTYGPVRDCHAATQSDAIVMLRNHARGGPGHDMTPADWRARAKSPNFTELDQR